MNKESEQIERPRASKATMWALREPETREQRRRVDEFLSSREAPEITRFPTYHDDRLNAQALAGRFERVVFADLDALLSGVWKGYLHFDEWLEAGVQIEIIDSALSPDQLRPVLAQAYASYARYRRLDRRRQTLAAVALSSLALAAMAAMIWLIPRMR